MSSLYWPEGVLASYRMSRMRVRETNAAPVNLGGFGGKCSGPTGQTFPGNAKCSPSYFSQRLCSEIFGTHYMIVQGL